MENKEATFINASRDRTLKNIINQLSKTIEKKYNKKDGEIVEGILRIHGIHPDNFDAVGMMSKIINGKLNDNSIDSNANKGNKTISVLSSETSAPKDKLVGYDYLYQEMKSIFGREEAKRLSGEMYDYSIALSDSSKILMNYCFSVDLSRLITEGRPFGQLPSLPCKSIRSYIGSACETLHQLSQHLAGAVAASTLFFDIAHLCLYKHKLDIRELKTNKWFRKEIENTFQHFVHSMNMLSRDAAQCFTPDVEVLTTDGFKTYDKLKVGDMVYTWNNGSLEIQPVRVVNVKNYCGKMHRYSGREYCSVVTPNHRVFHKKNNSDEYVLTDSSKLIGSKTPVIFPVAFQNIDREDYAISDDMLKLLTIILCDGCICHGKRNSLKITITKSVKRFGGELIKELLKSLNINHSESVRRQRISCAPEKYKEESVTVVYSLKGDGKHTVSKLLNGTKKEVPSFFRLLSSRQAKVVIDTWSKFDGSGSIENSEEKVKLQVDNENIADMLQEIAMIAGYGSSKKERVIGENKKQTRYVYIKKRKNKQYSSIEEVDYNGIVWCPTTDNGIVMFRDGSGNMFISGNSPFTNISINDKVKIRKVVLEMGHMFPLDQLPISKPVGLFTEEEEKEFYLNYIIDYIDDIQNIFLDFFDKGAPSLNGANYRFPVATIALSKNRNRKTCEWEVTDKSFLRSVCKRQIERYNIFSSEGTKFASCCFTPSQKVFFKFNGEKTEIRFDKLFERTRFPEEYIKEKELCQRDINDGEEIIAYNDGEEIRANVICLDYDDVLYEIKLENGIALNTTKDHYNVVWFNDDFCIDVKSEFLFVGNEILMRDGKHVKIVGINKRWYTGKVYCLKTKTKEERFDIPGDIITHNCRLINDTELMSDYASQANSFGAGGSVSVGSHRVCTINLPRLSYEAKSMRDFFKLLDSRIEDAAKILKAHKSLLKRLTDAGLQEFISNGYIKFDRLFSTFGIIGTYECGKNLTNKFGKIEGKIMLYILQFINSKVSEYSKKYGIAGNIEQIPGESMASRLVKVDKMIFGDEIVDTKMYSNQHWPLWLQASIWERLGIDGECNSYISGGGIAHATLGERLTSKQNEQIITYAVKCGCEHFALNPFYSKCEDGHIEFGRLKTCPKCGKPIIDYMTRIIGYFISVSDADEARREEIMSRPDTEF